MGFKSHIWKKKKKPGLIRVRPGRPGSPGSPGFWVDPPGRPGLAGLLPQPVFIKPGPVQPPGRPAGPGRF